METFFFRLSDTNMIIVYIYTICRLLVVLKALLCTFVVVVHIPSMLYYTGDIEHDIIFVIRDWMNHFRSILTYFLEYTMWHAPKTFGITTQS